MNKTIKKCKQTAKKQKCVDISKKIVYNFNGKTILSCSEEVKLCQY